MAARALADLRQRLSVPMPALVRIRFHPSVESFQRDTGRSSLTAAATVGSEIDLLPLSILKRRGTLERTLRHELVHLLTAASLKDRPLWIAEGLAVRYSGEGAASEPPEHERACPSDRELTRPESAQALRGAYERARNCVERAMNDGAGWREHHAVTRCGANIRDACAWQRAGSEPTRAPSD